MKTTTYKLAVLALAVTLSNAAHAGYVAGTGAWAMGSGVAIGDGANSANNGVAIGAGASAETGSIALGSESVADRQNTVSVGNAGSERQITNVAAGIEGTDAVNVNQLNDKAGEMLNSANNYTDGQITDTKKVLNTNINNAKNEAINTSNSYTDGKITDTKSELNANIDNAKNEAISTSNTSTDTKIKENNVQVSQDIKTSKQAAIATSKQYTDTRVDNITTNAVEQANGYTDSRVNQLNQSTNKRFHDLDRRIDSAEKRLNAGIAGVTAISSIPYVAENNFSYGIGLGNYQNGNAVAAGVQFKTSPNTNIRVNMSWDSSSNNALGVGFAGGW